MKWTYQVSNDQIRRIEKETVPLPQLDNPQLGDDNFELKYPV